MDKYLPILGIETSGALCSVCLMLTPNEHYELSIRKKNIHSEKIFAMADEVLKIASLDVAEINSIAVSIGPGSFTGLRIGTAVAKGIAYGINVPIIPVPTFDAMAFSISKYLSVNTAFIIANKVNRSELYVEKFLTVENNYTVKDELKLIVNDSLTDYVINVDNIYGNYQVGNQGIGENPSALMVAEWGYFFGKDLLTFEYDYLEPNYLKNFVAKVKK